MKSLPTPSSKRIAIRATKGALKEIRSGHPWLFDGGIEHQSHTGDAGDLAVIFDQKRKFQAIGLYDPHSPIRVKILHVGKPTQIEEAWFANRVEAAIALRHESIDQSGTNGYRLIYGEGDGLPGLVVDRYGDALVVKLYTAAWFPHLSSILAPLRQAIPSSVGILRLSRNIQPIAAEWVDMRDGDSLWGEPPTEPLPFLENRLRFKADIIHGHKTGFFFDHRDNRERVGNLARGRSVLDLFAYSGGFSIYAAAGGAVSVTSVDISGPALEAAEVNLALNSDLETVQRTKHETCKGDVYAILDQLAEDERDFDLIVVDPPAFAKKKEEIERAIVAYERLVDAVLKVLAPGGILVFASCSSRVTAELFFEAIYAAAESAGRPLWTHFHTGHAIDHPVLERFPEGAYLKCLYASPID